MIYTNKKYRYSLELPDGWRRRKSIPSFPVRGSTSAYKSPGDEASISVSVGLFEFDDFRDLHDHMLRRLAMEQFFKDEPGVLALEVERFTLDREGIHSVIFIQGSMGLEE